MQCVQGLEALQQVEQHLVVDVARVHGFDSAGQMPVHLLISRAGPDKAAEQQGESKRHLGKQLLGRVQNQRTAVHVERPVRTQLARLAEQRQDVRQALRLQTARIEQHHLRGHVFDRATVPPILPPRAVILLPCPCHAALPRVLLTNGLKPISLRPVR